MSTLLSRSFRRLDRLAVKLWLVSGQKPIVPDDALHGRILTRREVLGLLGASSAAMMLAGPSSAAGARGNAPSCIARPQQTEGPYFIDERLNRSDIRADPTDGSVKAGTPLDLTFRVSRLFPNGCPPLGGAVVDVWHCDHAGAYSDVEDPHFNTVGKKFLRGYQVTDSEGVARFKTIYPGWYPGRTVHIHFKIRSAPSAKPGFDFTSQLYFDDALTDRVHAQPPYNARGQRRRRNADDGIFSRGGAELIPPVVPTERGYAATFTVALQGA